MKNKRENALEYLAIDKFNVLNGQLNENTLKTFLYEKVKQQPRKLPPVCPKQNKHLRKTPEAREL